MLMVSELHSHKGIRIGDTIPDDWLGHDWFVATCKPGRDHEAREMFEDFGIPVLMMEGNELARASRRSGKRELRTRIIWPGYLFVAGTPDTFSLMRGGLNDCRHLMATERKRVIEQKRAHRLLAEASEVQVKTWFSDNPVSGWRGTKHGPLRVDGATMQAVFLAHESAAFVHKSVRDANRARVRRGDIVAVSVGPFAFVEGIVQQFSNGNDVEILAEIFNRKTTVKVPFDSLEKIRT
jgi:transcription antitermination factor NusG